MFKLGVTQKFAIAFTFIVFLCLLTLSLSFLVLMNQYSISEKEENIALHMVTLSDAFKTHADFKEYIQSIRHNFQMNSPSLYTFVWMITPQGDIEWVAGQNDPSMEITPKLSVFLKSKMKQAFYIEQVDFLSHDKKMTLAFLPIYSDQKEFLGSILTLSDNQEISQNILKLWQFLELSIFFSSILAGTFGILFSFRFSDPLKKIHKKTQDMIQMNYTYETKIKRTDELGDVLRSLNYLSKTLHINFEKIYEDNHKLKSILKSISDGILALDSNLNIIDYNSPFISMLEIDKHDVDIELVISTKLRSLDLLQACKESIVNKTMIKITKPMQYSIIKFFISPIKNRHDLVTGVLIFSIDITKQAQLEEIRKEFVANVSHEFRTPLTVIRGYVEAILDDATDGEDEAKKYLTKSLSELKWLEQLVSNLLDLSSLQSGKISVNNQTINLADILKNIISHIEPISNTKNITLDFHYLTTEQYEIFADYQKIRQVFIILIDNAIKYSKENDAIQLSLVKKSQMIEFKIQDHGFGISKKDLPYIWDRFYKVEQSLNRTQSSGLGLSIAKSILDIYDYHILVESEINQGTLFTIQFLLNTEPSS